MSTSPLLAVLVPVRNAAADLPGFLASVGRFADVVVALDDGSIDDSAAILRASPLVRTLLSNPPRPTYAGWDDSANRNALLAAAAELGPRWLLSLDADERIDEADGRALRRFLETDALPGLAYGLERFAMRGDGRRHEPEGLWQHRLFAYEPGQRFSTRRLHFAPVPTSIPTAAYVQTTFRIQHLGGESPERRRATYEKYRQADPDCRYWPDYTAILRETPEAELATWRVRSPSEPDIVGTLDGADEPARSTLTVLLPHTHPAPRAEHPAVEWLETDVDAPELDPAVVARAAGSVVLALPRDLTLTRGALDALLADHADGYALVAPAIDGPTGEGWSAVVARGRYAPTQRLPSGALLDAPAVRCSYRRSLLLETVGNDPPPTVAALNRRLHRRGFLCVQSSARLAAISTAGPPLVQGLVDAFAEGRRRESAELEARRLTGRRLRSGRRSRSTGQRGETNGLPRPLAVAASVGGLVELAWPARGKASLLAGRTQLTALWDVTAGGRRVLLVVSWSQAKGSVRVVVTPASLEIERSDGTLVALADALPSTGRVGRFLLHELIGRPFSVVIDDEVRLDLGGATLPEGDRLRAMIGPALTHLWRAESSIDRVSLGLFLLAARGSRVEEIAPWADGEPARMDDATAAVVAGFLDGHAERDPGSGWERKRRATWA